MKIRLVYSSAFSCVLLMSRAAVPSRANMLIVPTYDTTIASDTNHVAIENIIQQAIDVYDSTFGNNLTATIYFSEMPGGLGLSDTAFYTNSYSTFHTDLQSVNANPSAIAGLNANGGNSATNPVTGSSTIDVKSANGRAVGISGDAAACVPTFNATFQTNVCSIGSSGAYDGVIGLNTSFTFPPNSNDGSHYDLLSVVEHEIDEVLGLGSSLPNCDQNAKTPCTSVGAANPSPEDLFRYQANGSRTSLANTACGSLGTAFFSYSGVGDIAQFNTTCNGADFGDWLNNGTPRVQDAVGTPGTGPTLGPAELDALSAVGYQIVVPEPGTFALA